jgi:hypothetical protein
MVRRWFHEQDVFRIDHYLGKETVQNLMALRFANGILEPIWNRQMVDHVQITVAESMGIDFPILSDPGKSVARAYGVLGSSGFPSRWTFYVGIDGRIQQIDKQVRPAMHGLDIEQTLNALQTARRA